MGLKRLFDQHTAPKTQRTARFDIFDYNPGVNSGKE